MVLHICFIKPIISHLYKYFNKAYTLLVKFSKFLNQLPLLPTFAPFLLPDSIPTFPTIRPVYPPVKRFLGIKAKIIPQIRIFYKHSYCKIKISQKHLGFYPSKNTYKCKDFLKGEHFIVTQNLITTVAPQTAKCVRYRLRVRYSFFSPCLAACGANFAPSNHQTQLLKIFQNLMVQNQKICHIRNEKKIFPNLVVKIKKSNK